MSSAGTYGSDDVAGFNLVSRIKIFLKFVTTNKTYTLNEVLALLN